ncbi:transglutaminase family protein [Coraliomargarita sp. SDUM461004]|uniref:Transglutaminase family protein n=1 Tax=Thalassobacterium sedimentorum TaxID=3041258 RepID=A0ABU1AHB9_9BACT|nr:transglutaminase family protein [Coraliomargarita sp. SDUM461004]MDQ8193999.1 transglutaminase family protein [Coraliomargarita sp. SDUM461004]
MNSAIQSHAHQVEDSLQSQGIALTMGGEPTFIPAHPDAPEWNNSAMGEQKLGYARRMTAELIRENYPGALTMQVFGKWYPGEPLPRWNCMLLHRKSGEPLWAETERILLDDVEGQNDPLAAEGLMQTTADQLGLSDFVLPAYETEKSTPTGWVLPLDYVEGAWSSAEWPFSDSNPLQLFMGDSPVGLRLPLGDLAEGTMRTALTIEVRHGALEIFVPPLDWEGFQALIAFFNVTIGASEFSDIVFCGYAPKAAGDELLKFGLAADPGVLEVNLPPAATWAEYDRFLGQSARAASAVGLQLTKQQLNGAIYGTGGGAHLAFGGPSLEHNPFLLQPNRIVSILRYWQRHPALSYLFTGQYVGPGSQAPRVDEGPMHSLYELEVACEGVQGLAGAPEGELLDQFYRNLLTDSSGNTHRTEICFDKFCNPSAPNGKWGIIELRAFETFPQIETMSVIGLFVRTIIARLCQAPFTEPLHRFGPLLHDRYFLPAFLWEDVQAICDDLAAHGLAFEAEWLEPVLAFRCPSVGQLKVPGGHVDVRQAFESFPLMAEESQGANTVRVVDNSSDRLQVTLSEPGLAEEAVLLVNGVEVPFELVDGKMICGVRYKCASAYPALHPHVPIQSPLEFEWVSKGSGETMQAARYHYWNPFAPIYEGRPQDAEEAAQRRAERWQSADDLLGRMPEQFKPKLAPEFKHTLDLRRQLRS